MIELASLAMRKAVIEFQPSWTKVDVDFYAEPGMRARLVAAEADPTDRDLVRATFDFTEFEDHNRSYESANWYDLKWRGPGERLTTAREAGHYRSQDSIYLPAILTDEIAEVAIGGHRHFAAWKASGCSMPYVAWLEAELTRARALAGGSSDCPDSENPDLENADPTPAAGTAETTTGAQEADAQTGDAQLGDGAAPPCKPAAA